MVYEIIHFYVEKFVKVLDDGDAKFVFKSELTEMNNVLKVIARGASRDHDKEVIVELMKLIYELDDILTESLKQPKKSSNDVKQRCKFSFTPSQLLLLNQNRKRLKEIKDKILSVSKRIENSSHSHEENDGPTSEWSFGIIDYEIFGLEEDVKTINKQLLQTDKKGLNLVGISGTFGVGKTALAQKVFNSEEVKEHFAPRLWVCVTRGCEKKKLVVRMLENLGMEEELIDTISETQTSRTEGLGELIFSLHVHLLNKTYLIVLDDIWNPDEWYNDLLSEPPEDGDWDGRLAYGLPKRTGGAVIVTSRSEEAIKKMAGEGPIYSPSKLSLDDCFNVFKQAVKDDYREGGYPELDSMKEEIVNKCSFFPSALKAAGEGISHKFPPRVEHISE